jgi:hypothetical protein
MKCLEKGCDKSADAAGRCSAHYWERRDEAEKPEREPIDPLKGFRVGERELYGPDKGVPEPVEDGAFMPSAPAAPQAHDPADVPETDGNRQREGIWRRHVSE